MTGPEATLLTITQVSYSRNVYCCMWERATKHSGIGRRLTGTTRQVSSAVIHGITAEMFSHRSNREMLS
jgi:hypothetical protein